MPKTLEILRTLATCRSAEYSGWQELPLRSLKRRGLIGYVREWSWALKRWRYHAWLTPEGREYQRARRPR